MQSHCSQRGSAYSDSITYGLPDVEYENQSSGGVFEVVVNIRGPQMDKELFTGGLRPPAQSGTASFQPTFGVIFWANSRTRANADSQPFTLTFTLVYAYRVATSTTSSDLHHATCSQQFSFSVANPRKWQASSNLKRGGP